MTTILNIFLTQVNAPDDVIRVSRHENHYGVYKVDYKANDVSKMRTFYLAENDLMNYFSDIFKSLDKDGDPFVNVQVSTALHPSIMYSVGDFGCPYTRQQVENMIHLAVRTPTFSTKTERN